MEEDLAGEREAGTESGKVFLGERKTVTNGRQVWKRKREGVNSYNKGLEVRREGSWKEAKSYGVGRKKQRIRNIKTRKRVRGQMVVRFGRRKADAGNWDTKITQWVGLLSWKGACLMHLILYYEVNDLATILRYFVRVQTHVLIRISADIYHPLNLKLTVRCCSCPQATGTWQFFFKFRCFALDRSIVA